MKIKCKGDHQYSIQVVLNAPRREAAAVYIIDGSVRCVISKILQACKSLVLRDPSQKSFGGGKGLQECIRRLYCTSQHLLSLWIIKMMETQIEIRHSLLSGSAILTALDASIGSGMYEIFALCAASASQACTYGAQSVNTNCAGR